MLSIEIGDVIAVLQLLAPYLIAAAVLLLLGLIVLIAVRRVPRPRRTIIRSTTTASMILGVVLVANLIAFGPMSTLISLAAGGGQVTAATTKSASAVAEEIAEEGIVLLENDGMLPLATKTPVNLFGWASANAVYGGSGSGGLNNLYDTVTLQEGIEDAGFSVNPNLVDFYTEYSADRPEMSIQRQSWTLPEPPADTYSDDLIAQAQSYSDTAIVVISRMAGEGHSDMPTDVSKAAYDNNSGDYEDFPEGEHYLQLSQTERDMVEMVAEKFDNVALVYNGANPMELGFVEEFPAIKSVLWAPGPGTVGFAALGKILSGEVNPSGHTPDTFAYDLTKAPWWNNQFGRSYENMTDLEVEGMNAGRPAVFTPSFMNYVEGIYVGYKYYETAAAEGIIDYDATVQYSFGHGLSYTTFEQSMGEVTASGDQLSTQVTVTNTGSVAGKDAVELFVNPPYSDGGIEKSSANLVAFAKTGNIEPGQSETVTLTFALEDLASYDMTADGSYVVEAGNYIVSVNADSHTVLDQVTYVVSSEVRFGADSPRPSDGTAAQNLFEAAEGEVTYLSRAGSFANHEEALAAPTSLDLPEPYALEYHVNSNFDYSTYVDESVDMPTTGANNGMKLAELRGADYDDERWDALLDQLTVEEMSHLTSLSGYQTPAVASVDKIATVDSDGPAAINNNFTGNGSIGFPVEVMIASTWNKDLAFQYGEAMGELSRELGSAGWYAPGINTHRIAFGARNYEYFSEDGVLAGHVAAGAVKGAATKGVYAYIKHFALYDANGKMVSVWANEQSIREIYLKPFEIAVKDGEANAVMVSWNYIGNKWAGEWDELMNGVLRNEWGFQGMALTDFFRNNGHGFMNADAALANGVDAMLSTFEGGPNNVHDPSQPSTVADLRQASKNIMFTVVNSWVYDEDQPAQSGLPWRQLIIAADIAVLVLVGVGVFFTVRRAHRRSAAPVVE